MVSKREAALLDRVRALVVEVAAPLDIEALEVDLRGQGSHRVLRVVADTVDLDPSSGLDVDQIAVLSRRLGDALDEQDVIPGRYTLEVTSPGADRPLRTARDFARNLGRTLRVTFVAGHDPTQATGELTGSDEETITLRAGRDERPFALASVDHAKVVLPW